MLEGDLDRRHHYNAAGDTLEVAYDNFGGHDLVFQVAVGDDGPYFLRVWRQGGEGFYHAYVQVGEDGVFERPARNIRFGCRELGFPSQRQALASGWRLVRPQSDEENTWLMKAFYGETYWLGFGQPCQ